MIALSWQPTKQHFKSEIRAVQLCSPLAHTAQAHASYRTGNHRGVRLSQHERAATDEILMRESIRKPAKDRAVRQVRRRT